MEELLTERAIRANSKVPASPLGSDVRQGSDAGVTSIATTLDTLIVRTRRGESLTRRGLHESQRVPFALALVSIKSLRPTYDRITRDVSRTEQEVLGIGRAVIMDRASIMTPDRGLALRSEYMTNRPMEDPENPHLGCPVTLIDRFIRDAFAVVADEAVEKRLISLVD